MTNFNDRERGEEAKYAFDEENAFKIGARATRLAGEWAAGRSRDSSGATCRSRITGPDGLNRSTLDSSRARTRGSARSDVGTGRKARLPSVKLNCR